MKTNLFDKNNVEIQIGDKYHTDIDKVSIYTVFYKGGAICGGITEDVAEPLCWTYNVENKNTVTLDNDLSWLEIIIEPLNKDQFIEIAGDFLRHSFNFPLIYPYKDLTKFEKTFCSEKEYQQLIKFLQK